MQPTETKTCRRCGETKSITAFCPRTDRAHGVTSKCRACLSAEHKEWYARNKAKNLSGHQQRPATKLCPQCGQRKKASAFSRSVVMPDGLHSTCRECHNAYARQYHAKWRVGREDWRHGDHIRYVYQMTREEYAAAVTAQGGGCAICAEVPRKRLQVDHCHLTGARRALLCARCNTQVGRLEEKIVNNPQLMRYIAKYGGASLKAHLDQGA